MRRDSKAFRERFQRWKAGEIVYDKGRAILNSRIQASESQQGTVPEKQQPTKNKQTRWNTTGGAGYIPPDEYYPELESKSFYNALDPRQDYPSNLLEAYSDWMRTRRKKYSKALNRRDYELDSTLSDSVSDAAWRKRLGLEYNQKFLPVWNGDTVRLPKQLELEIPTDTTFLKNRIEQNKRLAESDPYYRTNAYVIEARRVDEQALEALRKTYKTGQPVGINEQAYNSRQWIKDGIINAGLSPLNVLKEYNIRYDKNTNSMYYSDEYDFNRFDNFIPGKSFRIRGSIKLPQLNK